MLWHMLLFGDAFGPAYAIFWCFCIQLCSFGGGSNFKKCFQQAIITLLYGRFRRSQQCYVQRMCVQQYVCVYARYTLCVHTAVRPRNIPTNIPTNIKRQVLYSSLHHYVLPRSCPPPRQSSRMYRDSTSYDRLLYVLLGAVVCAAVQLSSWPLVTTSLLYCCVLCMCVYLLNCT